MIYIFLILISLLFICTSLYNIHMLQQNSYNDLGKYQLFLSKDLKARWKIDVIKAIIFCILIISYELHLLEYIVITSSLIILIIESITTFKKHNQKLPIKFTKRVIRIMILNYVYFIILMYVGANLPENLYLSLLIIGIIVNPSMLILIVKLLSPVEKAIFSHYKHMAQDKLKRMNDINIIGITGSFGKTSTKMILDSILSTTYKGFYTPASFNTPNGITITINNEQTIFNDYFIAEMGAKSRGEIKELCDIIHPKYGIITKIGPAHLESFKTLENICNTKFELVESLPNDGIAILNKDDEYQKVYENKNKVKKIWIGIDNKADITAQNIHVSSKGTTFDIVTKNDKYTVTTILLGKKNVYNILSAVALATNLNVSKENIIKGIENIKPINHRLEIKNNNNVTIIDDSFNSNPEGAANAVEVLSSFDGPKYIITPGMIEMDEKEDELNEEFGKQIAKVADKVYLVGPKHTKPIYEGLIKEKFNEENIVVCKSFKEAYNKMIQTSGNKKITVLFENDLPDSYTEE